ncbi:MAG: DNA-binding protein [Parvularcula sp.]|nr:DNA-binding protein [Parvularcula sp.]
MEVQNSSGNRNSPFLRATEAAEYLGLTRSTLEHYRWAGGGPNYRKHGGLVFYHIDDLNDWSERRTYRDSATRVKK